MDKQEIEKKVKSFLWGLAAGVIGLLIIGFGFDVVVLTSTATEARTDAVETATVQQLATLCEARVRDHRVEVNDTADLSGWEQRDARRDLAAKFAIVMPGKTAADDAVIRACANKLDTA